MSIEVRGLSKAFGSFQALDGVDLALASGRLTALLGPSGGGKSTLLRVVAGLERPDAGRVVVEGRDVTDVPARRRGMGFVFQHYAAFTHLTVSENVAFGLRVARRPRREVRARVEELLEMVRLSGLGERYPAQLSGGQRQRMALARALATKPSLLLLDEPFGALDVTVRAELRAELRRLHDEVGATTVLVTHDQAEAMELADEVVVLRAGRVEQVGPPSVVYDRPANDFVRGFLGPVTALGGLVVRPHDVRVLDAPVPGSVPGCVRRVVDLGFEHRLEAELAGGAVVVVQLSRPQVRRRHLAAGDAVHLVADTGGTTGGEPPGGSSAHAGSGAVRSGR